VPTETRDTVGIRRENVRETGPRELFGRRRPLAVVPVARIELGYNHCGTRTEGVSSQGESGIRIRAGSRSYANSTNALHQRGKCWRI
jgi:hypothetical protein